MRTTLEIPDTLLRLAKAAAAERGIPLRELICEALAENLPRKETPWMKSFGNLRFLHTETMRINDLINTEFGQIESLDFIVG